MKSKDVLNAPIIIADAETTGKSPFFDQHVSSAKIRIHEDKVLNSFYQECRCENSRIPSPRALFVNGISTKTLSEGQPPSAFIFRCRQSVRECIRQQSRLAPPCS